LSQSYYVREGERLQSSRGEGERVKSSRARERNRAETIFTVLSGEGDRADDIIS